MDYIIATEQLTKKYKNFTSVNNVSLHVRRGSIYGFLGPNGAGKSTTMKMLPDAPHMGVQAVFIAKRIVAP